MNPSSIKTTGWSKARTERSLRPARFAAALKWLFAITFVYCAACGYLWFAQNRLIFLPDRPIDLTPDDYGLPYQEVRLPIGSPKNVDDELSSSGDSASEGLDEMRGWWIPAVERPAKVLLYLHGNSGNIGSNLPHAVRFHKLGFSVLLLDYRGYGSSRGGHPTEAQVYEDAEAAWKYLLARGFHSHQILIYGHSLGGAIAIELASRYPRAAGLIVESTFTSMRDIARWDPRYWVFPVDLLLHQRFDSITKAHALRLPVLVIHGKADSKIPFQMGRDLFEAFSSPQKRLLLIPEAEHSNSASVGRSQYFKEVQSFIQQILPQRRQADERRDQNASLS